ncbi:hypothetical protein F5Y05DRAFT_421347 [Hypoxylon sp. FL0543]|nr:hypothetical protein F5Y05DRAFT_421347 [Hypoxylon sp. FL0543]
MADDFLWPPPPSKPEAEDNTQDNDNMSESSDSSASSDTSASSEDSWETEEDAILIFLKYNGKSFQEVADTLGRGLAETVARYEFYEAGAREGGGPSIETLAKCYENHLKAQMKQQAENAAATKAAEDKAAAEAASSSTPNNAEDEEKPKDKKKKRRRVVIMLPGISDDEDEDESDSSEEDDDDDDSDSSSCSTTSTYSTASVRSNPPLGPNGYYADFVDVLCHRFPHRKRLQADRHYSERDVRALSAIEARYRVDKWLYIAADFANVTGRMVDHELLRYKFESGE